jgi:hypothetical protein
MGDPVSYVVVGLTDPCEEYPGHDCVSWVHGPFATSREARDYAGTVPPGFRPHILPLQDEDAGHRAETAGVEAETEGLDALDFD